jgi:hypothetical protein
MKFTHLLFILLLLSSCAFEPEGLNFNEVEKPTNTHPMEITLSANEDSIYLYGETKLSFTLSTFGKQLNVAKIHFYNQEIWTDKLTYTFTILPQQTSEWVDLTVDFYVGTGTGSIADKLKVENYFMSKTWKIKYFDLTKETLKTGYIINPDGYLELYLVKPKIKEGVAFGLSRYGNTIPSSRFSGDTVFFADKTYCADVTTYYLWYTFESNKTISKDLIVNLPKAQLKVEALGLDSCKVSKCLSKTSFEKSLVNTQSSNVLV